MNNPRRSQLVLWATLLAGVALGAYGLLWSGPGAAAADSTITFTDIDKDTRRFVAYNRSITLTPEQEEVRRKALSDLPAPCCSDRTAYTCCCSCNLARAWWGLSKHLIADRGYGPDEVRAAVTKWFDFINPNGFSGKACYTRGCNRLFSHDGCGGMDENNLVF